MNPPPPLALYVHLPWCVQKCPYCDFNSHALKRDLPADAYVDALLKDLDSEAVRAGSRPVSSIFFGGGTPSLFPPTAIARLLTETRERLNLAADAEITLEANPGTVEQARFEGFREAGVNRLSIGIQSFGTEQLQRLGRIHGAEEALRAAEAARGAGFDNFNLDLMFGLPEQDLAAAQADLRQAIELAPAHISYYQLTLEPNTLFHARPPILPDEDAVYDMHVAGQALLAQHGYTQYEVSAYAQAGRYCRHNLNYWLFGDYLAIGAGAHGKISNADGIHRYWKVKHPRDYQQHAGQASVLQGEKRLSEKDIVLEFMMNALRLREGFAIPFCEARTGLDWERHFQAPATAAIDRGLLERVADIVRPTEVGSLYLNETLELFLSANA
ncbi:YggW family oxidoreductase [Alkalilimnicola ehrlichii]|uniref:Heme chaperone HemW n=1 Tax=Alkalilimnicola ehrlichii TaxID=351052 RepID=A0A3E0X3D6_9GAMM|nr:radical SAM family heme chaperone HemW [Alkalilimnicola ehrlichii]RFA31166.1 YggW family oxidoreductase [Alkalilimnicola ehrlichii]RFA39548.1 YggW family oxidoreductase [Alkalilimnicola ehrlichii]